MLYATSQHSRQSLNLIRVTLEAIASEKYVSNSLRQMVYDFIVEAKTLTLEHDYDGVLSCSCRVESISLAVQMQKFFELSEMLDKIDGKEELNHDVANRLLNYL